jgi:hypothetical protein
LHTSQLHELHDSKSPGSPILFGLRAIVLTPLNSFTRNDNLADLGRSKEIKEIVLKLPKKLAGVRIVQQIKRKSLLPDAWLVVHEVTHEDLDRIGLEK